VTDWGKDIDPEEMMAFIREMGAVSIKEAKEHFGVNSRSARRAFAKLWYHDKVWVLPYRRALYATENTGKKGNPSIKTLRKVWTEGHAPKPKKVEPVPYPEFDADRYERKERFVEVDGKLLVDFPEES
jgi:hypothetical protein